MRERWERHSNEVHQGCLPPLPPCRCWRANHLKYRSRTGRHLLEAISLRISLVLSWPCHSEAPLHSDSPITDLLSAWHEGSTQAFDDLYVLVYTELKEMSRRALQREHQLPTLSPTVIVNEVYMRFARMKRVSLENRKPFFAYAAKLMRHVIVDYARAKRSDRRGRGRNRVDLEVAVLIVEQKSIEVLALEDALVQLEQHDPFLVKLIEQKIFAGFTEDETAEVLGVPKIRVQREWRVAKRLLAEFLGGVKE